MMSGVLFASTETSQQIKAENYVSYWEDQAKNLDWFKTWSKTQCSGFPFTSWYIDGEINACYNCLDRHVLAGNGSRVAFYWENEKGDCRVLTYKDMYDEVNRLANYYKSLGLKKGDRIAIYMPMVPESLMAMLAAVRVGMVHNFIFGGIGGESVRIRINDSEAALLVTADGGMRRGKIINYKKVVDEILPDCPSIKSTLVFKYNNDKINMVSGRDFYWQDTVSKMSAHCPCVPMESEDMMFLLYTSGTTGKPKGIIHTTGGYLVGVNTSFKLVFDAKPETDIYWCTADPGWITGHSYSVYGPMCNGMTQVMYDGSFDYPRKDQFAYLIEKYRVTTFYTAPTFISMLMQWGEKNCIGDHKLATLRLLGSIGEPLKAEVWHWYNEFIGNKKCPIVDTWFQTETGALAISPIPWVTKLKPGSITKALPGYEADVLDEAGNSVKQGFLALLHPFPSMMRGIYKDNERYLKTYFCKWNGKYYYAGDRAKKDDDDYIYVGGRADEVLKVAGHRIGTAEVETSILNDLRVAETAVIGVQDKVKGSAIAAFVVLKDAKLSCEALANALKLRVQEEMGSYARPSHIIFVPQVPKNRSGKIIRRLLKSAFDEIDFGNTETLINPSAVEDVQKAILEYKKAQKEKNRLANEPFYPIKTKCCLGKEALKNVLQPLLSYHLQSTVYNRLYPIVDFLKYYKTLKDISILEALKKYDVKKVALQKENYGSCFTLINQMFATLPSNLNAHFIPVKLSKRFKQEGWDEFSHTAICIYYENEKNKEDEGFVLLEPNLDVPVPLFFSKIGDKTTVDMGEKRGLWTFEFDGNNVICYGHERVGEKPWTDQEKENNKIVFIVSHGVKEPYNYALRPMMGSDQTMSVVSRDAHGKHMAHLKLNLPKKTITCSLRNKYLPQVTFEEFLKKPDFDKNFCKTLNVDNKKLVESVLEVIKSQNLLKELRDSFLLEVNK